MPHTDTSHSIGENDTYLCIQFSKISIPGKTDFKRKGKRKQIVTYPLCKLKMIAKQFREKR